MKKLIIFTICSAMLFGCIQKSKEDKIVAKVFEAILMESEVKTAIPQGISQDDSILMSQNYVQNWVTRQLLLQKAIENLSLEEKNIHKQVEDYRTSILIYRYKQKLIEQKLTEEIPENEIETYYESMKNNFVLPTPIAQSIFCIIPKTAPHIDDARKWYKSNKESDIENLEEYCITNARKYDNFDEHWVELKYLLNLVPGDVVKNEHEILSTNHLEREDNENFYFLTIRALLKEQNIAPLDYIRDEIILIMKNKKKIEFEQVLEEQINEEALRKKSVLLY